MKSQAITEFGKPLQSVETPTPTPTGTEVLVKVEHCGVCHSDVHIHDGYFDLGGGAKLPLANRVMLQPPAPEEVGVSHSGQRLDHLIGQYGRSLTPLRPSVTFATMLPARSCLECH